MSEQRAIGDTPSPMKPIPIAAPKFSLNVTGSVQGLVQGDFASVTNNITNNYGQGLTWSPPFMAPPTPAYDLVGRNELYDSIKERLLLGRNTAISALGGKPGVGKTALAVALANDPDVLQAFPDGVLWAGIGKDSDVTARIAEWAVAVGAQQVATGQPLTAQELGKLIRSKIGMRRLLIVVDDVWSIDNAQLLRVGGPFCGYLLTTRVHEVALHFAAGGTFEIQELRPEDGLTLLCRLAPNAVAADQDAAADLVRAVGGLPLGIAIMGGYLAKESHGSQPTRIREAIERLRRTEERLNLEQAQDPLDPHPSIPAATPLSLYVQPFS